MRWFWHKVEYSCLIFGKNRCESCAEVGYRRVNQLLERYASLQVPATPRHLPGCTFLPLSLLAGLPESHGSPCGSHHTPPALVLVLVTCPCARWGLCLGSTCAPPGNWSSLSVLPSARLITGAAQNTVIFLFVFKGNFKQLDDFQSTFHEALRTFLSSLSF